MGVGGLRGELRGELRGPHLAVEGHVHAQQLRAVEEVARERGEAEDADDGLAVAEERE